MGATVLGITAGIAGSATLLFAGYLLYQRLWGDSVPAFVAMAVLFGGAGSYAGWILGMVVFSAVRGPEDGGGASA